MILCLDRLEKAKAKLVSTTENIEGDDPMGRFTRTLLAAIDEMERERGAIRTSIAMRSYQAAGRRMGAKLPFGYMTDPANPALMVDCEYEKDIKEPWFSSFRKLSPLIGSNKLKYADLSFGIAGQAS